MWSQEQVAANLPHVFKEKYPSTYAIIEYSLRPPVTSRCNHLHGVNIILASVWLVVPIMVLCALYRLCTLDLFQVWNLQECLASYKVYPQIVIQKCPSWPTTGSLSMINKCSWCGSEHTIYVTGGKHLMEAKILHTLKIASVRIHVERVIGYFKNFAFLKGIPPITMARLAN